MCQFSLRGLQLLVIDNDPDSRELLKVLFEADGVEIVAAASAGEALAVLEQTQPDLLISEICLPDEDGYSLISKIRAIEGNLKIQIPAIVLTTCTGQSFRDHALVSGFCKYLSKPFNLDELVASVAYLTGRAQGKASPAL